MQLKDYYHILNISRNSTAQEIKKAFRRLALQYHPDRNPENVQGASIKFKEINEAYEVLGNEHKRWQYDRLVSQSNYQRRTTSMEDTEVDSIFKMLRRMTGMSFVMKEMGRSNTWNCRRCNSGQCHRRWRKE